ncbi:hypothetical protein ACZ90_65810 [Streptomyces albus subsp. albus]|nr:hypothetical protein ACZ90_65810 [Streptomyces albus subsp. albus]
MGWTVLYIAFGIVALWLLGEVLLQYKARLRWRLLAFTGFLGVVTGVLLPSVIVIGIGGVAFAVGQTYVTLSFRRGFTAGWALKTGPVPGRGAAKRRAAPPSAEPTLEVSGLEAVPAAPAAPPVAPAMPPAMPAEPAPAGAGTPLPEGPSVPTYHPEPLPDDTGGYAAYRDPAPAPQPDYPQADYPQPEYPQADYPQPEYPQYGTEQPAYSDYGAYTDYAAPAGATGAQDPLSGGQDYADTAAAYGYGADPGAYPGYADPYAEAQQQAYTPYEQPYDPYAHQQYAQEPDAGYAADPYPAQDPYATAAQGYPGGPAGTPAEGVWVPQQRDAATPPLPSEQPAAPYQPYQQGYPGNGGYDEQYRY